MSKKIFMEGDEFSWRKIATCVILILFAWSVGGFLITHHHDEIPMSYQIIIETVILSYFAKDVLRKFKITQDK